MTRGISPNVKRALADAGREGVLTVQYSTGRAIKNRNWAEEISKRSADNQRAFPSMTLRLNADGLRAAAGFRRERDEREYADERARLTKALPQMLDQGMNAYDVCSGTHQTIAALEASGASSAKVRALRDVLMAHIREEVGL